MRHTVHKWFWAWDFDKEEAWLNDMAAKGLALISVGLGRYEYEDCVPGEYRVCIQFLENGAFRRVENGKYIEFLEETGAQHVGTFHNWAYFRKKAPADFALFSDRASLIRHLSAIIGFIAAILALNLYCGCYNLFLFAYWHSPVNSIGVVPLLIAAYGTFGLTRLIRKRRELKSQQQVFE